MQLSRSRVLLGLFNSIVLISCATTPSQPVLPLVDVCVSHPSVGGFICVDPNQKPYTVLYKDSDKMIGFDPVNFEIITNSCEALKGSR